MQKLGFGCMRFPINNDDESDVNIEEVKQMIDLYMERGFNYFDTAYVYHMGNSEKVLHEALVERYPRDSFILTDKLPLFSITKEEELEQIFNEQLERCGVEYFDYYLLHNVCKFTEKGFVDIDSFGFVNNLKKNGLIKHMGISFHDTPEMLDEVLTQHPEIEIVQLQINYFDWESESVKAKKCYEVALKHKKDVIVMEPIKGGTLINLSPNATKLMKDYNPDLSEASWAIRFCASLDNVKIVLSGMSSLEQMEDNISYMSNFKKLNNEELEIIDKVTGIMKDNITVECTKCNYCIDYCPKKINIPYLFELYNTEMLTKPTGFSAQGQYYRTYARRENVGIASDCIECEACVEKCPQHLKIPEVLKDVKKVFEISMYGFN